MHPIKRLRWLAVLVAGLVMMSATSATAVKRDQSAWEARSGGELIRDLQRGETRDRAFYELWRRANGRKEVTFAEFLEHHQQAEVVVCPQEGGEEPIYLILYGFLTASGFTQESDYPVVDADGLFPPVQREAGKRPDKPAIEAFTASGNRITPFGGGNVLEGSLSDINGDRVMERVEIGRYGVEHVDDVEVLEILAVKTEAQPLLRVLINWGAEEWSYRLNDTRGDGIADIELGPRTGENMKTKVVYRWDATTQAYVGPEGKIGDHFRRLKPGKMEKQFAAFRSARMTFPRDQDFEGRPASVVTIGTSTPAKPEPPASKPYQKKSLAEVSDAELLRLMGRGRSAYDFERESVVRNHVPAEFWAMEPKRAALAVVEGNRSEQHRASFRLAVDDRGGAAPPEVCSLTFSDSSSRCYNAVDAFYFLRVDPKESYLAYARSWSGGAVFYSVVFDQPAFDLRVCRLSYEEARHLAQTIWWLDRVRSRSERETWGASFSHSTADGRGALTWRDSAGALQVERKGSLWAAELTERWNGNYNHEAFVNFSAYLMTGVLTQRLGKTWTDAEPKNDQNNYLRQERGPRYTEEEMRRFRELTKQFLGWFSPGQERVSVAIASCAAEAAGTLVMPEARPLLEKVLSDLPADSATRRSYSTVDAEYRALRKAEPGDPKNKATWDEKIKELAAERDAAAEDSDASSPAFLRKMVRISLRKINAADDPAALYSWAIVEQPGSQWAMQRLSALDQTRYVAALEVWMSRVREDGARQIFEEIRRVAPARATAIAAALPPEKRGALTVAAYSHLQAAGRLTDEKDRLKALLAVLKTPKSGWEERGKAIDLLVPRDAPLRYPQREVDDALLRVLDADMADDTVNFTLANACRALALRQRTATFGRMEKLLGTAYDTHVYDEVLGALVHLAQADPERFNGRIRRIAAPQLKATNKRMTELLWAIWAADLRELQPELERLGTDDVDDYEDRKASSSGGDITPVLGRFHLARKIADVWNADDAATQIRLLTALALGDAYNFVGEPEPARLSRLKAELVKAAKALTVQQRERLEQFFKIVEVPGDDDSADADMRKKLVTLVREAIKGT